MNFPTTHWSVLAQATLHGDPAGQRALEALCRTYWRPVADFLQFRGLKAADAEDMTQEFFHALLQSRGWQRADRARGKFRTFLLGALTRVLARDRERRLTQKRGAGEILESLDRMLDEDGTETEAADDSLTRFFEEAWATQVLDAALHDLECLWAADGKSSELAVLLTFLPAGAVPLAGDDAAARLGITPGALKVRVHRLRQQFRERLEAQVARTVSTPQEIAEEMAHLHRVLADPAWSGGILQETPDGKSAENPV